ncbi:LA2681 family HEPN domain-containing protein [Bacillus sp. RAR_GA_16]|uniref:LA2681 family HEPN domain-containing protein n=1 Tax=Bacillus sp. RAR_GA_16 TaxID=2876774 RepID=UPI001CCF606D|nr:LA2681 family HEPN domain-containing protein [Bacillus sp. RAR_GA_16]MCA0174563.1 hypothetical protein [Bacillus sp. RAR_GA_16]
MSIEILLKEADERLDRANPKEIQTFLDNELEIYISENEDNLKDLCILYYIKANHLSMLKRLLLLENSLRVNEEINHLQERIIHSFRSSLSHGNPLEIHPEFLSSIITNLANELDHVGRFIEAIELWKRADLLFNEKPFPMASGNMGLGYLCYANLLYEDGHKHILRKAAYHRFSYALDFKQFLHSSEALQIFSDNKNHLENLYHEEFLFDKPDFEKSIYSKEEEDYRKWCLDHTLFLNPLNDINNSWSADRDILGLPSIVVPLEDSYPIYHSYINQIKQEYVSARWFLYESTILQTHFSDKQTSLYNTLDYQSYGLSIQTLKVAFRSIYSIFDKIGFFLYKYFEIKDLNEKGVSFKSIWYKNSRAKKLEIRDQINIENNLPLKGLFWLSKDFFYKGNLEYREVMEPDSTDLDELRNHLEHKFISIYDDAFSYSEITSLDEINRSDLFDKTLRILKLARAAIIYLSLGIHQNETILSKNRGETLIAKISIDQIDDEWKQ